MCYEIKLLKPAPLVHPGKTLPRPTDSLSGAARRHLRGRGSPISGCRGCGSWAGPGLEPLKTHLRTPRSRPQAPRIPVSPMWINCRLRSSICGNPCYFLAWSSCVYLVAEAHRSSASDSPGACRGGGTMPGSVTLSGGRRRGGGRSEPSRNGRSRHRGSGGLVVRDRPSRRGLAQVASKRSGLFDRPSSRPTERRPEAVRSAKARRPISGGG